MEQKRRIVQLPSRIWLFVTPWTAAHQASLSSTISWSFLKFMSIRWYQLTISSFAGPLSFCLQSFPASGSFPMSQLFASDVQSIGASASALPMNIQFFHEYSLEEKKKMVNEQKLGSNQRLGHRGTSSYWALSSGYLWSRTTKPRWDAGHQKPSAPGVLFRCPARILGEFSFF